MKIKFNSIRFKISVLYTAILGAILVVYSTIHYATVTYIIFNEFDDELFAKAQEVVTIVKDYLKPLANDEATFVSVLEKAIELENKGPNPVNVTAAEARWLYDVDRLDTRQDLIHVIDHNGRSIAGSDDFTPRLRQLFSANLKPIEEGDWTTRTIHFGKKDLRVVSMPYDFGNGRKCIIQVGTSFKRIIHLLYVRLMSIAVTIPIVLLLASFIGRVFALRILKPVVEITKTAEKITHEDLSTRVKTEHADEEMKFLVQAFNDMISRLEKSFRYIEEFSGHVAHELKTPLAIIHGESEVASRSERTPEEYQRVIQVTLEESERMIKVVEDMLLLTRMEYESEVFKFIKFDLVEFLRDICEHSKILVADKTITVNAQLPGKAVIVYGDHLHLRRLFFNLIDNAKKFSPYGGTIEIRLRTENGHANVSVSDNGIGIDEADLPKIFGKFYRHDPETNRSTSGTGLGLNLALSIAKAHHGDIEVTSQVEKGSTFTVVLPTA